MRIWKYFSKIAKNLLIKFKKKGFIFCKIIDIIHKYDKEAFVIVTETKDVHREGFTYTPRI